MPGRQRVSLAFVWGGDIVKELKEYNDYVEIVKRYLSQYGRMQGTAESMRMRAKTIREELLEGSDIAAPISKYGDQVGGGSPELNTVEAAADRRAKKAKMAAWCDAQADAIEHRLELVDHALSCLDEREQYLLRGYYFEKKTWVELAMDLYLSETWARKTGGRAVKTMAAIIFGEDAVPEQMAFHLKCGQDTPTS